MFAAVADGLRVEVSCRITPKGGQEMALLPELDLLKIPYREDSELQVKLDLTPDEWFDLCSVEGKNYLGHDPGLEQAQKALQEVFHRSGWMTLGELKNLETLLSVQFSEIKFRPSVFNCMKDWLDKIHWICYAVRNY